MLMHLIQIKVGACSQQNSTCRQSCNIIAVKNQSVAETKQYKAYSHNLLVLIFPVCKEKGNSAYSTGKEGKSSDCFFIAVGNTEIRKNNSSV